MTSQEQFAKQGIEENVRESFEAYKESAHLYKSVDEWAEELARGVHEMERLNERDTVKVEQLIEWAVDEAKSLLDECSNS